MATRVILTLVTIWFAWGCLAVGLQSEEKPLRECAMVMYTVSIIAMIVINISQIL